MNVLLPHTQHLGYQTKQESIAVQGVPNLVIRSLLNKQQFYDPGNAALDLGISSAFWSLFGLLWPSGSRLAERMALRPVNADERILELGCGLGLASLVGHRRGANITASDCHPLAGEFLRENLRLNHLSPIAAPHLSIPEHLSHSARHIHLFLPGGAVRRTAEKRIARGQGGLF